MVSRPGENERSILEVAVLDIDVGLVGDNWRERGSRSTGDGSADPRAQITIMSSRLIALLAGSSDQWAQAGDQFFVDLDLSIDNLPPGQHLRIGSALVVVSDKPHTGCAKFSRRFGQDALRLVNSPEGKRMRLRGLNARVVMGGTVEVGDDISKVET